MRGCCPPLALPRTHLGGEIIGFDPSTGQFVQAAAGTPARIVDYPYYAAAGRLGSLGDVTANILWGAMAVVLVVSLVVTFKEGKEALSQ